MKPFAGVQAVSFDVGGTLIDPWPSVGHVYAEVAREVGWATLDPVLLNARFATVWSSKRDFDYTREGWWQLVQETFRGLGNDPVSPALFGRLYERFTEATAWRLYEDVRPTLAALRRAGYQLAVVSNWDDRLRPLLRNLKLEAYFAVIEVSGESGFHKPSPRIFQRTVSALELSPRQVLHVGDSLREDFHGAGDAGLRRVLLSRAGPAREPDRIAELTALGRMLGC